MNPSQTAKCPVLNQYCGRRRVGSGPGVPGLDGHGAGRVLRLSCEARVLRVSVSGNPAPATRVWAPETRRPVARAIGGE